MGRLAETDKAPEAIEAAKDQACVSVQSVVLRSGCSQARMVVADDDVSLHHSHLCPHVCTFGESLVESATNSVLLKVSNIVNTG